MFLNLNGVHDNTMTVSLSQFTSLFEIGFALHFAVAFLDRIYARELPVRIDLIIARAKSIERFKQEISEAQRSHEETGKKIELHLAYRIIENPIWVKVNDLVLDRLYALRQDSNGQMKALKRILKVIRFLSVIVVLYSVTILFMIGLEVNILKGLTPMTASVVVLIQLLPLPIATGIFFFVARSMSKEVDRKIRGVEDLNLLLSRPENTSITRFASVKQIYHRDLSRNNFIEIDI